MKMKIFLQPFKITRTKGNKATIKATSETMERQQGNNQKGQQQIKREQAPIKNRDFDQTRNQEHFTISPVIMEASRPSSLAQTTTQQTTYFKKQQNQQPQQSPSNHTHTTIYFRP